MIQWRQVVEILKQAGACRASNKIWELRSKKIDRYFRLWRQKLWPSALPTSNTDREKMDLMLFCLKLDISNLHSISRTNLPTLWLKSSWVNTRCMSEVSVKCTYRRKEKSNQTTDSYVKHPVTSSETDSRLKISSLHCYTFSKVAGENLKHRKLSVKY